MDGQGGKNGRPGQKMPSVFQGLWIVTAGVRVIKRTFSGLTDRKHQMTVRSPPGHCHPSREGWFDTGRRTPCFITARPVRKESLAGPGPGEVSQPGERFRPAKMRLRERGTKPFSIILT